MSHLFRRITSIRHDIPGSFRSNHESLARERSGLWANRDFMNLWGAETVSQLGSQITPVAIPLLAALTLDATPFQMGVLAAASGLPVLVVGFVAGAWVDRLKRRPIMLAMDIGRAITLLAIPFAAVIDALSIELLMIVSLLAGMQTVFFNAAYASILPVLVGRSQLAEANGKLHVSMSVSQVAGPALAGSLVSLVSAPVVILIDAVTFLCSGWFIGRIRVDEPAPARSHDDRHFWREVREGFDTLWASPVLRATTASSATINFSGFLFLAVYVLYMTDDLGLSSTGVGLVYAAGGVGSLIGSLVAPRVAKRFGVGRTIVWSAISFGGFGLLVPLAILVPDHALPLIVVAELIQWMTLVVFHVIRLSVRQSLTPDRLQGRVAASDQVLAGGMQPVGSFLGGVIGSWYGVQTALIVGVIGMFLAAAWVWRSPTASLRTMPGEPDPALDPGRLMDAVASGSDRTSLSHD